MLVPHTHNVRRCMHGSTHTMYVGACMVPFEGGEKESYVSNFTNQCTSKEVEK